MALRSSEYQKDASRQNGGVKLVGDPKVPIKMSLENGRPFEPDSLEPAAAMFLRETAKLWQMTSGVNGIELTLTYNDGFTLDLGKTKELSDLAVEFGDADLAEVKMETDRVHFLVAEDYLDRAADRRQVIARILEKKLQPKHYTILPEVQPLPRQYEVDRSALSVKSENENLPANFVFPAGVRRPPAILLLHGAGEKVRRGLFAHLQVELASRGMASLAGDLVSLDGRDSLEKRQRRSRDLAEFLMGKCDIDEDKLAILGHSMGGHLAVNLVEQFQGKIDFKSLVLTAPAAYGLGVEKLAFGPELRSFLHADLLSWSDSAVFSQLEKFIRFGIKVQIIIGENDEVISPGIQVKFRNVTGIKAYQVPNRDHRLFNEEESPEIAQKVINFLVSEMVTGWS